MPTPTRFSQIRWLQNAVSAAGLIGAGLLMLLGLLGYGKSTDIWMIAAGGFALFIVLMATSIAPLVLKVESTIARQLGELRDLHETVAKQTASLESIVENTRISDAAKSLAHRQQEISALRNSIRDEIRNQHWEPALNLADEIERRFGYKQEADRIREELDDARNAAIQSKLAEAIAIVEGHFQTHAWDRAQTEIDRLQNALPNDVKVQSLQDRLKAYRDLHKKELLGAWDEAVRKNDTDHAIDVLRELDQYLSPAEGHALQASARTVFKEKLLQLGVQFRFAVNEKRWQDALSSGLELIREFPNARMANEVRDVMDTLRDRARQAAETEPVGEVIQPHPY